MRLTESLAERVVARSHSDEEGYQLDPMTVMAITAVLVEVIKLLSECQKNKRDATKEANKPSMMSKMKLRRVLMRRLGPLRYLIRGRRYMRECLEIGRVIDNQTMRQLYKENNV